MAISIVTNSSGSLSVDPALLEAALRQLKTTEEVVSSIRDEIIQINSLFRDQTDELRDLSKQSMQYKSAYRDTIGYATEIRKLQDDLLSINDRLGTSYIKENLIQQRIKETSSTINKINQEKTVAESQRISQSTAGNALLVTELDDLIRKLEEQKLTAEAINFSFLQQKESLANANKEAAKLESKTKAISSLFGFISRIPLVGPFLNAELVQDAFLISSKKGFAELGDQLKNVFTSPLVVIAMLVVAVKKIIDVFLAADEAITKMGNNLGVSREAAGGIYKTFRNIVDSSNQLQGTLEESFLNATNMTNALMSLQDSFETSAMLSTSILENQILLTKQMGLSNEEAEGLQRLAYLNKTTAKDIIDISLKQNKTSLSYKKILLEISKVNSEISASYKNNPELIAKAVVQANKLGMSLEDTRKISDSLLNFESSIDNELKAELLTGQQLNFEKARALALDGKSAEAAAELVGQMGGMNALTNLNIIQRKGLAESIGLSAEELTKFAQKEELAKRLGSENYNELQKRYDQLMRMGAVQEANALLRDIEKQQNGELMAQDISRASLNARFAELMTKIQEIIVDMSGPIEAIVRGFIYGLDALIKWGPVIKSIIILLSTAAAISAIASGGISAIAGGLSIGAIGIGAYSMYANAGSKENIENIQTPASAVNNSLIDQKGRISPASVNDSLIDQKGRISPASVNDSLIDQKGRIIISTPKGKILPSEDDSIITTTNPTGLLSKGGKEVDNSGIESRLDQLINAVKNGSGVYMDSRSVGTYQGMNRNSFA